LQPASSPRRSHFVSGFFLSLLLYYSAAAAEEAPAIPLSAELAVTSDYVYRGQSFSDGRPAVQAAATWRNSGALLPGVHVDAWASSIDFGDGDPTDAELSAILGYEVGALDAGVTYIAYLGAPRGGSYDYVEIYAAWSAPLANGALSAALHYTPNYSGDAGPALFSDLEGSWPLSETVSAVAAVGHARLDPRAGADYFYWQAGLSAQAFGLTFEMRYHGNDARLCASPCADRVALSISKAF
jgi:uncharacterized protein (TIGR02001 family)